MQRRKRSNFKAGMYLLENLTTGMYNDPMSIYREYVQNAVDSIEISHRLGSKKVRKININLDPRSKNIIFFDNGIGVESSTAEEILSSIGSSNKMDAGLRGFRGIGRLGGLAFCDKAIFRTKTAGEQIESIQEWDCVSLRRIINSGDKSITIGKLFDKVTSFSQRNGCPSNTSYFEVTLFNVFSFRNHIFDIDKIKNYLSQVAPIPFDKTSFKYGEEIDDNLSLNLTNYKTFNIFINNMFLTKPYKNNVKTSQKKSTGLDEIEGIKYFNLKVGEDENAAYCWIGLRRDLLGSIRKGENYSGIRVRAGNIMIGSPQLLNKCFREDRFNSYLIGEVHINTPKLKPNSRRDDFIDGDEKTLFYNAFEKEIGLPFSKEIRLRSRNSSVVATNVSEDKQYQTILKKLRNHCQSCQKYNQIWSK